MPTRILATPGELGRMARKSYVKKGQRRGRAAILQGKRTGFAAPGPSRIPVGTLETKVKRNNYLSLTPSNIGQLVTLNTGINQGTAVYNRIGHKFRTTACRIKGHFLSIGGETASGSIVGYALVWDKSPNGATPGVGEIFTIDAVQPGYDMENTLLVDDNSDRFKILSSTRRFMVPHRFDPQVVLVDELLKLPAWCVSGFKKGVVGGTTSAHLTGALYIVPFVKNTDGTIANNVKFNFTSEVYFAEG